MQKVFPNRNCSKASKFKQESTPDAIELSTSSLLLERVLTDYKTSIVEKQISETPLTTFSHN
jgi:hypothetical protein